MTWKDWREEFVLMDWPRKREYVYMVLCAICALTAYIGPNSRPTPALQIVESATLHHPCGTWIAQSGGGTPPTFRCVKAWRE